MSVGSSISSATHITNSSINQYDFNFMAFQDKHLAVTITIQDEGYESLILFTDYTVSLLADYKGGTIILTASGKAKAGDNKILTILRSMPFVQELSFVANNILPVNQISMAADIAVMERQQLREILSRTMLVAPGTTPPAVEDFTLLVVSAEQAAKSAQEAAGFVAGVVDDIEDLKTDIIQMQKDVADAIAKAESDIGAMVTSAQKLIEDSITTIQDMIDELAESGVAVLAATQAEVFAGIKDNVYVSPETLNVWAGKERAGRIVTLVGNTNIARISDDNGLTWRQTTLPITSNWYHTLVQLASGRLFAMTTLTVATNRCIVSDDFGETWKLLPIPPSTGAYWNGALVVTSKNRIVAIAQGTGSCWMSDDEGESWFSSSIFSTNWNRAIGITKTGRIVAMSLSAIAGYAVSDDDGETWVQKNKSVSTFTFRNSIHTLSTGRIVAVAVADGGCFHSDDNGDTWVQTSLPFTDKQVVGSTILAANDRIIVFPNSSNQICITDDGGVTWTTRTSPLTGSWWGGVTVTNTGRIISITGSASAAYIIFSDDNGETWTQVDYTESLVSAGAVITTARPVDLKINEINRIIGSIQSDVQNIKDEIDSIGPSDGLPVGTELSWAASTPPPGYLDESLDHGQLPRALYPDLWAFALGSGNLLDEATWLAYRAGNAALGADTVPSFSTGNGTTTFRIPLMRKVYIRIADPSTGLKVGSFQADTGRNATGQLQVIGDNPVGNTSGVFTPTVMTSGIMGTGNARAEFRAALDLSKQWGQHAGDEFRPLTVVRLPVIKAFGAVVNQGLLDAALLLKTQQMMFAQDIKASGTSGGSFASAAWRIRDINTISINTIPEATRSGNYLSLPTGEYWVEANAPAYLVGSHVADFYNVTAGSQVLTGTTAYSGTSSGSITVSTVKGQISVSTTSLFALRHYCATTGTNTGFGLGHSLGSNIFSQVLIRRMV